MSPLLLRRDFVSSTSTSQSLARPADAPTYSGAIPTPLLLGGPSACLCGLFVAARTVQATMFAAHTTRRLKLLAQPLAGTMQPDVEVVQGCAQRQRRLFRRDAFKVHALQHVAVLLRQSGQKAFYALAKHALGSGIGLFGKLGLQTFERAVADITPPVEVDDGMTQDTIEPCHRAFTVKGRFGGLERLEQAVLHQVGREFRVAHALARERDEGVQVLNERVFGFCHARKVMVSRQRGNRRRPVANPCYKFECKRIPGSALARAKKVEDRFDSEQRISL
jgi:hypothetical protein